MRSSGTSAGTGIGIIGADGTCAAVVSAVGDGKLLLAGGLQQLATTAVAINEAVRVFTGCYSRISSSGLENDALSV